MEVPRDHNHIPATLVVTNNASLLPVALTADPNNHGLITSDGTTGSNFGPTNAERDENHVTSLMAVSSVDGTPVVLYADALTGALLTKST